MGFSSSSSTTSIRKIFDKDQREAKPGDLIEIFRGGGYQHWAVYVGGENVVHFQVPGGGSNASSFFSFLRFSGGGGVDSDMGVVKKEKLEKVVEKNNWRVNNLLDHKYTPRPADDIVKNACSLVKTELQYNVLEYNCEHFATEMRYGKAESEQAKKAKLAPVSSFVNAAGGYSAGSINRYLAYQSMILIS